VHAPPVVGKDVENTEDQNEERCRPLSLETNSNHDAGTKTNDRNKDSDQAPFTLDDETKEKEDKKHTASKEETRIHQFSEIISMCKA